MTIQLAMGAIQCATRITYHQGAIKGLSPLVAYARLPDNKLALFLKETPFHPVDPRWPDQPADKGSLTFDQKKVEIIDCRIFAVKGQEVKENNAVSPKEEGWQGAVGHIIDAQAATDIDAYFNRDIQVDVEAGFRQQISLHHTACHLAAFALNIALKDFWKKGLTALRPQDIDALGSGNFDQMAMDTSFIYADRSEDRYRFGSSLKKVFKTEDLMKNLPQVQAKVNQLLAEWTQSDAKVGITAEQGNGLTDKRMWLCSLPMGSATMPCGGTHMTALSCFKSIVYTLEMRTDSKDKGILATTRATMMS